MEPSNVTINFSRELFYKEIITNSVTKIVLVIITIIASTLLVVFNFGIIWYERFGSDKKRTIINKMMASTCRTAVEFYTISHIPESLYFVYQPRSSHYCFIHLVIRRAYIIEALLKFDSIIVLRYMFIFCLKNPSNFQDDFWTFFLNLWIRFFSLGYMFPILFLPGKMPFAYHFCAGTNPVERLGQKQTLHGLVEFLSLILHLVLRWKIWRYKKSMAKPEGKARDKKYMTMKELDKTSIAVLAINTSYVVTFMLGAVYITWMDKLRPDILLMYPNHLHFYFTVLVGPWLFGIIGTSMLFFKHPSMTKTLIQELKNLF